jgi:hypothetical protein
MTDLAPLAGSALDGHYSSGPSPALLSDPPPELAAHLRRLAHAAGQGGALAVPRASDDLPARLDRCAGNPGRFAEGSR